MAPRPGRGGGGPAAPFPRNHTRGGHVRWPRQFGTSGEDEAIAIAVDASGAYVVGRTNGALPGQTNGGTDGSFPYDAFVIKYDTSGNVLWTRQFGTSHFDQANGIALDASGVYVSGLTWDALPGQTSAGSGDAFLRKYDASGNVLWTRQFGSSDFDQADNVAVDASGAYVAGVTAGAFPGQTSAGSADAFVIKYDTSGNVLWTRQFGSSAYDQAYAIAVDASGAYVAGYAAGALPEQTSTGGFDAFVRKYDVNGNEVWTRQFGTQANANLGVLPGSVPWAIYAAVAAGAAALGSAGRLRF